MVGVYSRPIHKWCPTKVATKVQKSWTFVLQMWTFFGLGPIQEMMHLDFSKLRVARILVPSILLESELHKW